MKSFSKPSIVAAMAAEFGRDPRTGGPAAADWGLLLRARLEVCADRECIISLSRSAPELCVMVLRCVLSPLSLPATWLHVMTGQSAAEACRM